MEKKSWKHGELFLRLMLVFMFIGLQIYYYNISPTFKETEITDTDSFTRLTRVEDLYNTGDWYDSFNERSNAPYGESQHWTRPLDVLLLIGGWALSPFFGFKQGLLLWGIIFNPLLGAFTLFILHRLISPYFDIQGQRLVDLLFFCQFATWETYIIGHPDHHGLIITLFIVLLSYLFRMLDEEQPDSACICAGLAAAISFWVSVETIVAVIIVFLVMGLFGFWQNGIYIRRLTAFNLTLLLSTTVFLMIERPINAIFIAEYDKISIVHVFVFTVSLFSLQLLSKLTSLDRKYRFLSLLLVSFIALAAIWLVFPDFYGGPFVQVNTAIIPIWLSKVSEVQPLTDTPNILYMLVGNVGLSIISLFFILNLKCPKIKKMIVSLIIILIIYIPLSFYQLRWYRYSNTILFFFISFGLFIIIRKTFSLHPLNMQRLVRILVFIIFLIAPFASSLIPGNHNQNSAFEQSSIRDICFWINENSNQFPAESILLAHIDWGPEILYRTKLRIIASPYHRNDDGILFAHQIMTTHDYDTAKNLLAARKVDFILISNSSLNNISSENTNWLTAFTKRLSQGKQPNWLKEIYLPHNIKSNYRLFQNVQ